jgi:hypothetical protein
VFVTCNGVVGVGEIGDSNAPRSSQWKRVGSCIAVQLTPTSTVLKKIFLKISRSIFVRIVWQQPFVVLDKTYIRKISGAPFAKSNLSPRVVHFVNPFKSLKPNKHTTGK